MRTNVILPSIAAWLVMSAIPVTANPSANACLLVEAQRKKIDGLLQQTSACSRITTEASKVNQAFIDFLEAGQAMEVFYSQFSPSYEESFLKPYRSLEKQFEELMQEAASKGLLLTPEKRQGPPVVSIYPASAFASADQEADLAKFRREQKKILGDMFAFTSSASEYTRDSKVHLEKLNVERAERLETLKKKRADYARIRNQFLDTLFLANNEFAACIGVKPEDPDEALAFFERVENSLHEAGVALKHRVPSVEGMERRFSAFVRPKLNFPEGGNLLLLASEVETLVMEREEAAADSAEHSIVIESLALAVSIKETSEAILSAIPTGSETREALGEVAGDIGEYFQTTSSANIAVDATITSAKGVILIPGAIVYGTVTTLWDGITGLVNAVGSFWTPDAGLIELGFTEPERPDAGDFALSTSAGRRAYIAALQSYRKQINQHIIKVRQANENLSFTLVESGKAALGAMEAAGLKGTGAAFANLTKKLAQETTEIAAKRAARESQEALTKRLAGNSDEAAEAAQATVIQQQAETLSPDAKKAVDDLLDEAEKKKLNDLKKKNDERIADRDNKIDNHNEPPDFFDEVEDFVAGDDIPEIKGFNFNGNDIGDIKFGKLDLDKQGTSKTFVKTNRKGLVGLQIRADEKAIAVALQQRSALGLEKANQEAIENFIIKKLREREELAAKLVKQADPTGKHVQVAKSQYTPDGRLKVAEEVDASEIIENRLTNNGRLSPVDEEVFRRGINTLNESGYIWLDPNIGNAAIKQLDGSKVLKIIDEDGVIDLKSLTFENPLVISGTNDVFDLKTREGIFGFQKLLLDGKLSGNQGFIQQGSLTSIKQKLGDPLMPISGGRSPLASTDRIKDTLKEIELDKASRKELADNTTKDITPGSDEVDPLDELNALFGDGKKTNSKPTGGQEGSGDLLDEITATLKKDAKDADNTKPVPTSNPPTLTADEIAQNLAQREANSISDSTRQIFGDSSTLGSDTPVPNLLDQTFDDFKFDFNSLDNQALLKQTDDLTNTPKPKPNPNPPGDPSTGSNS